MRTRPSTRQKSGTSEGARGEKRRGELLVLWERQLHIGGGGGRGDLGEERGCDRGGAPVVGCSWGGEAPSQRGARHHGRCLEARLLRLRTGGGMLRSLSWIHVFFSLSFFLVGGGSRAQGPNPRVGNLLLRALSRSPRVVLVLLLTLPLQQRQAKVSLALVCLFRRKQQPSLFRRG
jgi:hypothetical protein